MSLTQEQLDLRIGGITGTDIAAICGVHPYKSAIDVYCEKLGLTEPKRETAAMRLGTRMEAIVAEEYEKETGLHLQKVATLIHHENEWLRGSPDRITVEGRKVVELKTAGFHQKENWGPPGTDVVPVHYLLQCAWYLALLGYSECDLALMPLGGWTPEEGADKLVYIYPIARDMALEQTLLAKGKFFWEEHIKKETPPALDGSDSSTEYLKKRYSQTEDIMLPSTFETEELYRLYGEAHQRLSAAEVEASTYANRIKNIIGNASGIAGRDWRVTWKQNKEGLKTDWKQVAFEANAPQCLIDKHTENKPGVRVFRAPGLRKAE